jgi:hypothetical protein
MRIRYVAPVVDGIGGCGKRTLASITSSVVGAVVEFRVRRDEPVVVVPPFLDSDLRGPFELLDRPRGRYHPGRTRRV